MNAQGPQPPENPVLDPHLQAYLDFLATAGVRYTLAPDFQQAPPVWGAALLEGETSPRRHGWDPAAPLFEICAPAEDLAADVATRAVARVLLGETSHPGQLVVEIGCGTGLLSVLAARRGARVVATELDPRALALARATCARNGAEVELREGSLLAPLQARERVALFLANLPHKPVPKGQKLSLAHGGGPEGDSLWRLAGPALARHQNPGGRLLGFLHSLPHPRLLVALQDHYRLTLCSAFLRYVLPGEFQELMGFFRRRHQQGRSFLVQHAKGEALVAGVWRGVRR